jgi:aminoglycoside 6'-N-acetyltransferase
MDLPTLRGERVLLRPLTEDDLDAVLAILAEPAVARWWGPQAGHPDREELLDPTEPRFAIVVGGAVAGWLACEENRDPMYRSVGLDLFLTTSLHGQGLGREALRLVIAHFVEHGHHRFTIDPAADNERAIRAYAAVGFKPVGRMREYELGADGTWHDGLLMDLLASELVPA